MFFSSFINFLVVLLFDGGKIVKYEHVIEESWEELVGNFKDGEFSPRCEADIQCYLYSLLLKNIKYDVARIHAEWKNKSKHTDITLGKMGKQLAIEIKCAKYKPRGRKIDMAKSWSNDVKRLSKTLSSRKPSFVLFVYKKNNKGGWEQPKMDPKANYLKRLAKLKKHAETKRIKVYSNDEKRG